MWLVEPYPKNYHNVVLCGLYSHVPYIYACVAANAAVMACIAIITSCAAYLTETCFSKHIIAYACIIQLCSCYLAASCITMHILAELAC